MSNKCPVIHCSSSTGVAPSPTLLTAKKHEIVVLDPDTCAMIVYQGKFEVIVPQERKFMPIGDALDSSQPRFIVGVDDDNAAIVFRQDTPPSSPPASLVFRGESAVSDNSGHDHNNNGIQAPEPIRVTTHRSEEPVKKRKAVSLNAVRSKYAERLLAKLVNEFVGATLIVNVDGKDCSAPITSVSFNAHGTVLFCVNSGTNALHTTVSDWLYSIGYRKGVAKSDFAWWNVAHVQRQGGPKVLLHTIVPWDLKAFIDEQPVLNYLARDYLPLLNGR